MTGVLSNGSLLKTMGFNQNGVMNAGDGIGLFGNNTYTGSTRISGGLNVVTGTNASTSVEVFGSSANSTLSLQGANGSYLSATTIQAFSGATFQIDNNAALGGPGNFNITVPAAQNNNRLADNVALQLRDGGFTYRGLANTAATETIGSLAVLGGHNVLNLATSGTGTVALTVANDFTMAPRSSLGFNITTLGGTTKLFVNGAVPAGDATGILPRVVTTSDFVTYNGVTGFTPYTGYATDFTTAGTNVSTTGAATVASSVNVNAVKSTNTGTTTINAGQTLGVTSGMVLSASGTRTYAGGTMAFGSTPGAFFGSNTVSTSAITGSAGLLNAQGTLTLNGDLSGLTGTMTQNGFGQTTLATNTFGGAIEVREGQFNLNTSQTLAGQGAITLGVSTNDVDLVGAPPLLSLSGAPASSTFARDIIVSNGSLTNNGVQLGNSFMAGLGPLSNTTGSQTVSGNITLNTPFRIQGGGAGGTGSTNFTGNITGPSSIRVVNGRMTFSGNYSNAGGFWLGETGNVTQVTFNGTAGGTAPLIINGSNTGSFIAYTSGALPTGLISTNNSGPAGLANLTPLDNSTINNNFALNGVGYSFDVFSAGSGSVGANVGAGLSSTWTGQMSGLGGLVKSGAGILTLSNASNTYTGTTTVSAGTLFINGDTSGSLVNVTGGTLGGTGPVGGITAANGTVAPGNGAGLLTSVGNVTFNTGTTFKIEIGGVNAGTEYDRLQVTGTVNLGAGVANLNGLLINAFTPVAGQQFTIIQSTGGITGTFAQGSSINIGGTDFTITYNANSVVLSVPTPTPTPTASPTATATATPTATRHRQHQQRHRLLTATPTPAPTPTPTATVGACVVVTASAGDVGPTNYADVGSAFAAINAGIPQGVILVSVTCDTVEPVSAILNASGTGSANYTSVTVNPVGTRTVSGTLARPLINLNGADNVTIDGLGGGNSLTLDNTSTAATASTVHLIGDASNNVVTNCTIKGASSAVTRGTIFIDTGTATGNIGNTFSNNSITNSGANFPVNGIFSRGTSATVFNSGTITQNNIQDYFSATLVTAGINLGATGNSAWSITNNRLFQTADRVYTTGNTHSGIFIGVGAGYTISGNVIGFANSAGTGTTNTIGNSVALPGFPASYAVAGTANATLYRGINAAFTAAGAVSNIQGNTIAGHAIYTSLKRTDLHRYPR